jgi:hypothetical protein
MSAREKNEAPARADWRPMLAARAVRNVAADVEPVAGGGVRITIRKAPAAWRRMPWKWVVPGGDARRVTLDRLGGEVWQLCDGRNVEAVIDELARRHRLSFHEARVAVVALIRELIRRGAMAIAMPPSDGGPDGQNTAR